MAEERAQRRLAAILSRLCGRLRPTVGELQ
jgi:hypothetical protein